MTQIPLQLLALQEDGIHLIMAVSLFDQTHHMVLDTGASKTVFDKATIEALATITLEKTETLSSGLGTNEMESYKISIPEFQIGELICRNYQAAVLDLSAIHFAYQQMGLPQVIGVLGGDILYQYGGIIDYKKLQLTLNQRKRENRRTGTIMKMGV